MSLILSGTDGLSDVDGSAATPAIRGTDANTGIFFPAADTIAFAEGGVESMRIDANGTVGIGVTPASFATVKALQLNTASTLMAFTNEFDIGQNVYYNAGNKYITTGAATMYAQTTGQHQWFNAASGTAGNTASFTQAMTLDASGNLGIGITSPLSRIDARAASATMGNYQTIQAFSTDTSAAIDLGGGISLGGFYNSTQFAQFGSIAGRKENGTSGNYAGYLSFGTNSQATGVREVMRLDSSGNLLVGKTSTSFSIAGTTIYPSSGMDIIRSGGTCLSINRTTNDGNLVDFYQDGTLEGSISVSGTTVSYNGGHLSRYAQTTTAKDDSIVKGTVLSNLDEMNVYTKDGQPVANEQLNKVKVSDTEGDANVAGVFVNWSHDEDHNVDEINMAMTGDMIIRIAQGVTVARGDLLMSAGDGTAKPQGDDIVRSKTVAKVTSNHVTCTYADGSYCVPCVLMAC
jgi:hypothetical protein